MKVKATKEEKAQWEKEIKELLDGMESPVLYTGLRHVSRSGMKRIVQVIAIENNTPLYLGYRIAAILDRPYDEKKEGVVIGGCGTDVGFEIVYQLSSYLYRDPDGKYSHEGAYKIKQRWL